MSLAEHLLAALLTAAQAGTPPACACPCARPVDGPGLPAPVHTPGAAAFALNREGRDLYRQRRFAQARARYRAAMAADPGFLGPRLNVACAFAQEQRFAEAVAEAAALAQTGFVPWAREIREAADLAPLQAQPERKQLAAALERAGAAWGQSLRGALLFVARTRPPVRLPAEGVLYLGLEQEIFAFLPGSGRYRQVTAEDGRVLGFLPSSDGDTIVYLRAGKLVRAAGRPVALRGVTIRRLELPSMALSAPLTLPGDVTEVQLSLLDGGRALLDLRRAEGLTRVIFDGQQLRPARGPQEDTPPRGDRLLLDGQGVSLQPRASHELEGCRFSVRALTAPGRPPRLQIRPSARGQPPFELAAPLGAGLRGLPFPTEAPGPQ